MAFPVSDFKAAVLSSGLVATHLAAALRVEGSEASIDALLVIQEVAKLAQGLGERAECVMFCRHRAQRMCQRAAALVPALDTLIVAVLQPGVGLERRMVPFLSATLVELTKVLLDSQQLLARFSDAPEGRLQRIVEALNLRGHRQAFEGLEQELRDCLVQLSATLAVSRFPPEARLPGMVREQLQQVEMWRHQNERDQLADSEELEGLMLHAVGGVEGLHRQLAEQQVLFHGVPVRLQQVADWLRGDMGASCSRITAYLAVMQRGHV